MPFDVHAAPGTGGGGGTIDDANNGLSVFGTTVRLGHSVIGSGASDFTLDRYLFTAGFKLTIGGTAGDNGLVYDGATGIIVIGSAAANGSAILELVSTTKGFLTPKLTTAQRDAIVAPVAGLYIYNTTTNLHNYYDGSAWVAYSISSGLSAANNGVSASGSTVQLGHAAAGSGASNFTANRYQWISAFRHVWGGSTLNDIFTIDGNTNAVTVGSLTGNTFFTMFNAGHQGALTLIYNNIGATQTDYTGFTLKNNQGASPGAQQVSPNILFQGQGWKTAATAATQPVAFRIDNLPVQGVTNPSCVLRFSASINGAAYTDPMLLDSAGNQIILGVHSMGIDTSVATQVVSSLVVVSPTANVALVLMPKGTGGLMAQKPTGSSVGGNARGSYAVDFQTFRSSASQVASGTNSCIPGGVSNTASGAGSFAVGEVNNASGSLASVVGGQTNTASGNFSICLGGTSNTSSASYAVTFGTRSLAYLQGMISKSAGMFIANGDSQVSEVIARRSDSTLTTAKTTILYIDGAGIQIIPSGPNRAWSVSIDWIGIVTNISGTATGITVGDTIVGKDFLSFNRIGGTSLIVDTVDQVQKGIAIMKTSVMTYTAGGANDLTPTFTAPTFAGGGTLSMRITMNINLVEVAY